MKITTELLGQANEHVSQYLQNNLPAELGMFDFKAVLRLVQHCDTIAVQAELGRQDKMAAHLACLFLYTGYCTNPAEPEVASAQIARHYLTDYTLDADKIDDVIECIMATRPPVTALSEMAQVVCDALSHYYGSADYMTWAKQLRVAKAANISDEAWLEGQIASMESHFYFTKAAIKRYDKNKKQNLTKLKVKLKDAREMVLHGTPEGDAGGQNLQSVGIEDNLDNLRLDRAGVAVYRISSQRQLQLLDLAHSKSGMLVQVNAILLSVVLGTMSTQLKDHPAFIIPTILITATAVTTIVMSVLVTRPVNLSGLGKQVQSEGGKNLNLLFFWHFYSMDVKDYLAKMRHMVTNDEKAMDSLAKDIFYQGVVLASKYRLMSWAYLVFIFGLIISCVAFVIAFF
jgi:hypothetical protein